MKLFSILKRSSYLKNILTLGSGTVFAQIILVAATPLVTRLYTAEEIGVYSLILAIVTMLAPIVNGRYEIAIVMTKNDFEANCIAAASLLIQLLTISVITLTMIVLFTFNIFSLQDTGWLIFSCIPIIILIGITNILTNYNNRYNQYKLIASVSIIRAIGQSGGQVFFGILNFGSIGILIAQFLASFLGLSRQAKFAISNIKEFYSIKKNNLFEVIREYKKQPFYSAPAMLINTGSYSLLVFFISTLFGAKELGYYFLSFRMLGLPIQVITVNVSKVYFAKASEEFNYFGNYKSVFNKTVMLLSLVSIPLFLVIAILAPWVFEFIFGEGWGRAGTFVAILAPMFALRLIVSSLSLSLALNGKQNYEFIMQIGFILFAGLAFTLSYYFNYSIQTFLVFISALYSLNYIFMGAVLNYFSKGNLKKENEYE